MTWTPTITFVDGGGGGTPITATNLNAVLAAIAAYSDAVQAAGGVWLIGSGAPSSGLGQNGQMYIDYTALNAYGPKTAGAWGSAHPLSSTVYGVVESALDADFGALGLTSPASSVFKSGSFTAESTSIDFEFDLGVSYSEGLSGNAGITLAYTDAALKPTGRLHFTAQGVFPANVTFIACGTLGAMAGAATLHFKKRISGFTIGHTYRFELAAAIVGYATNVVLPDTPTGGVSCSNCSVTPNSIIANDGLHIGDCIVAACSATKMHLIKSNHLVTLKDELMTGAGKTLTGSRSAGNIAVSPDGKRVAVANFGVNSVSIFDISTAALLASPSQIGSDVTTTTSPNTLKWSPDSSTLWVGDYVAGAGHVQKITGAGYPNTTPVAAAAVSLTDTGLFISYLDFTPDGTKLLVGCTGARKVYIVNTSSNAVGTVTLPGSNTTAYVFFASSNTLGYALLSGGGICDINLTTPAVGTVGVVAISTIASAQPYAAQLPDGYSCLVGLSSLPGDQLGARHILLPSQGGGPNEYVGFPIFTSANAHDICRGCAINDHGSFFLGATTNVWIYYGGKMHLANTSSAFTGEHLAVRIERAH